MPSKKKAKNEASKVDQLVAQAEQRAAEAGIELEPEEYSLEWYRQDWPARKRIFIEREIRIRNAFNKNKLEDFLLNDGQVELYESSLEASEDPSLEDATLKCRRLGITTYYLADYFSDAVIESGHHVRIVAQDPDTLRTLMRTIKTMYDNLRPEIKPASKYNSIYDLEMNDPEKGIIGSRLSVSTVAPGQEEKGRGDTITRLHLTEIPFWKGDAETAAVALCDAAKGGKISYESTAKGVGDFFHKKYTQGKRKEGGMRSHFFEWWYNRNYQVAGAYFIQDAGVWYLLEKHQTLQRMDQEEREKARVSSYTAEERLAQQLPLQSERDCSEAILAHLKRKGYVSANATWSCEEVAAFVAWRRREIEKKGAKKFRVEYPENDKDPFTQTGGTIFDQSYLVVTAKYRDAEPGHSYKVFLDPSNGVEGGDPYDILVIDCKTGEQVYDEGGIKKQDEQAKRCCELSDQYNDAEIGIESNMGEAAILEVERLGYGHRLYKHISADAERDIRDGKISYQDAWLKAKPGLPMTDRMKRLIINEFEKAWRIGEFKCASEELIEEAQVFVQNGNTMAAKSGYRDDKVMAGAGCWYLVTNSYIAPPEHVSSGQKLTSALLSGY